MTKEKLWAAIQHSLILHTGSTEADNILGAISELERRAVLEEREACISYIEHSAQSHECAAESHKALHSPDMDGHRLIIEHKAVAVAFLVAANAIRDRGKET